MSGYNWRKHVRPKQHAVHERAAPQPQHSPTYSYAELATFLTQLEGKQYPAYKELRGRYTHNTLGELYVDYVQGDPFANPSKFRFRVPASTAQFPSDLFNSTHRKVALANLIAKSVHRVSMQLQQQASGESSGPSSSMEYQDGDEDNNDSQRSGGGGGGGYHSARGGIMLLDFGGQEVIPRTTIKITADFFEVRFQAVLPARGRRIMGIAARKLLVDSVTESVRRSLLWSSYQTPQSQPLSGFTVAQVYEFVNTIDNYYHLQSQMAEKDLIAFIPDGAILPRASGVSQLPLSTVPSARVVPFQWPEQHTLRVTLELLHSTPNTLPPAVPSTAASQQRPTLSGLGIKSGITLIVGGGFHGKSTMLEALERAVYPHVPGDGREYVVTIPSAVKIRAEDNRSVQNVDISAFIAHLPLGKNTKSFSTQEASGSTSQAANIVEAVECGSRLLLIDEDTSATNLMIRDARMQALVAKNNEPITPLIDRIRELYTAFDTSSILVMGGSGDYFDVADQVIALREYQPRLVTQEAKEICARLPTNRVRELSLPLTIALRTIDRQTLRSAQKIKSFDTSEVLIGDEKVDLSAVSQIVESTQASAIAYAISYIAAHHNDGRTPLCDIVTTMEQFLHSDGMDRLNPQTAAEANPGQFSLPRRFELAAALNRMRSLRMSQSASITEAVHRHRSQQSSASLAASSVSPPLKKQKNSH